MIISDIRKPVILFDTSGINYLYDDVQRERRLDLLRGICYPRVTFTALDEVAATPEAYRRKQLVEMILRLQNAGDCVLPFHVLLTNHVKAYSVEGNYDWNNVDSVGTELKETIIAFRHEITDELASLQRTEIKSFEMRYKNMFETVKNKLAEILEDQEGWPLEQFMQFAFKENGSYWKIAAGLMGRALTFELDEQQRAHGAIVIKDTNTIPHEEIREFSASEAEEFATNCPPFKAMLLGLARSEYARAHDQSLSRDQRRKAAGRIDTYSSLYLPYCRFFVTADRGQFDCLSFVAQELGEGAEVVMYERFWEYLADPSFRF